MTEAAGDQWVINASPLICLGKIGCLNWLTQLAREIVIPSGVAQEIGSGPDDDPARSWLHAEGAAFVQEAPDISAAIIAWDLGRGESEVLAWAQANPGFRAVLDDRAARRCADVLNVPVCGTLGVVLRAKRHKLVPSLAPIIDELTRVGLRLSPSVRDEMLRVAGESSSSK